MASQQNDMKSAEEMVRKIAVDSSKEPAVPQLEIRSYPGRTLKQSLVSKKVQQEFRTGEVFTSEEVEEVQFNADVDSSKLGHQYEEVEDEILSKVEPAYEMEPSSEVKRGSEMKLKTVDEEVHASRVKLASQKKKAIIHIYKELAYLDEDAHLSGEDDTLSKEVDTLSEEDDSLSEEDDTLSEEDDSLSDTLSEEDDTLSEEDDSLSDTLSEEDDSLSDTLSEEDDSLSEEDDTRYRFTFEILASDFASDDEIEKELVSEEEYTSEEELVSEKEYTYEEELMSEEEYAFEEELASEKEYTSEEELASGEETEFVSEEEECASEQLASVLVSCKREEKLATEEVLAFEERQTTVVKREFKNELESREEGDHTSEENEKKRASEELMIGIELASDEENEQVTEEEQENVSEKEEDILSEEEEEDILSEQDEILSEEGHESEEEIVSKAELTWNKLHEMELALKKMLKRELAWNERHELSEMHLHKMEEGKEPALEGEKDEVEIISEGELASEEVETPWNYPSVQEPSLKEPLSLPQLPNQQELPVEQIVETRSESLERARSICNGLTGLELDDLYRLYDLKPLATPMRMKRPLIDNLFNHHDHEIRTWGSYGSEQHIDQLDFLFYSLGPLEQFEDTDTFDSV